MILLILGMIICSTGSVYIRIVPKDKWNLVFLSIVVVLGWGFNIVGTLFVISNLRG